VNRNASSGIDLGKLIVLCNIRLWERGPLARWFKQHGTTLRLQVIRSAKSP
jgi:hypothetical protein